MFKLRFKQNFWWNQKTQKTLAVSRLGFWGQENARAGTEKWIWNSVWKMEMQAEEKIGKDEV